MNASTVQVTEESVFGLLTTFLPPLLAFSPWMWLDCIAQTSLGMLLEEECLCQWILTLQVRNTMRVCHLACPHLCRSYLYLRTSGAFCLFLHAVCLLSGFLDQRNWFVHNWGIAQVCWCGAGGAGCWTPGGRRALRRVRRRCCRRLARFPTAPAQRTFPPRTCGQGNCQALNIVNI